MATHFDNKLQALMAEMMITSTNPVKKPGEDGAGGTNGMQPTAQGSNPNANQPAGEQKVPATNVAAPVVNPNAANTQNGTNDANSATSHWADTLLDNLKGGKDIDIKSIAELNGLSPEQKALLAHHLLAK